VRSRIPTITRQTIVGFERRELFPGPFARIGHNQRIPTAIARTSSNGSVQRCSNGTIEVLRKHDVDDPAGFDIR
jgi:hypothetical protein